MQVLCNRAQDRKGAIHSTKISGHFGPKLNGSVRSYRKSFEKTGPPFEVDHFSRSDRLEFWLNGSRPKRRRRREIRAKSGERLASRSTSASFAKADKTELNKQSKRKTSKIKARQNKFTAREMLEQLRREGDDTRCIWN